ncbi:hypothetical protein ACJMK2_008065 [Sinanodonta woodiana]|uniref:Uncharacterized protein n=1 Tax=Sinanodonta woodiana TaxID=1069815 RepID=A0ABD3VKF2_SINWO
MLRLLLAFVLVGMVMGEGCCPPNAWEGFVGTMVGFNENGVPHLTKGFFVYHQNSTLGMVAMEGDMLFDGWYTKIKIIKDNIKNIQYVIINGTCTKQTLVLKAPNCIPENATRLLNTYLGAGPENLVVKVYRFMQEDTEVYSTVTSSGCIPVDYVITGTHPVTKAVFMEVVQITFITVGVKDPTVFVIPSVCDSADTSSDYVPIMNRLMPSGFY